MDQEFKTAKVIMEREHVFEFDHARGVQTMKNHQFPNDLQGAVQEPMANALDQQKGDDPIQVFLRKKGGNLFLTYKDNGEGFQSSGNRSQDAR